MTNVERIIARRPAMAVTTEHSGGDGSGIDGRIAALESDVKELKTDLKAMRTDIGALRVDIAHVRGRIDSMPTTIQLLMFVIAIFVAAGITRLFGH